VLLNGFAGPKERDAKVGTPNKAETDGLNEQREGAFIHEQRHYCNRCFLPVLSQMVYGCREKKAATTVAVVAAQERSSGW
jgi:hypothetical protein